jgi:hypothetical protein
VNRKDFHTKIVVRVFYAGKASTRILKPKPGHHWNDAGVDEILDWVGDQLEKRYPGEEFRIAPAGPGCFNFIHAGKRAIEVTEESKQLAEEAFQGMIGDLAKQLEKDEGGS